MRIQQSQVSMQAVSQHVRREAITESLKIQVRTIGHGDVMRLSPEGQQALEDQIEAARIEEEEDPLDQLLNQEDYQKLKLLERLLTWLTGKDFKFSVMALRDLRQQEEETVGKVEENLLRLARRLKEGATDDDDKSPAVRQAPRIIGSRPIRAFSVHYERTHTVEESESLSFQSKGQVTTEDGRAIDFEVNLHMARERSMTESMSYRLSDLVDPLIFHFDGPVSELSDKKIQLDLTLDGQPESFHVPLKGSGFLVMDRNGNGKVDDGTELFGPTTGKGFEELAELDDDGNGWIDENDASFTSLKVWTFDEEGNGTLTGLLDKDVGAIFVGAVHTNFTMEDDQRRVAGVMKGAGTYLKESGGAGIIHEVDLKV